MTLVALVTGALWGAPIWGTYWEWDPRLTSFLILLLFYLGYIALWSAIEDPDTAADLTSILCIVGSIFAVLSRRRCCRRSKYPARSLMVNSFAFFSWLPRLFISDVTKGGLNHLFF